LIKTKKSKEKKRLGTMKKDDQDEYHNAKTGTKERITTEKVT
jgi:hypothetical protein